MGLRVITIILFEVFCVAKVMKHHVITTTKATLLRLNQPLRRTYHRQKNISYIAPIIWNNLPNSLKTTDNLNTYKHRVEEHFCSPNKK